MTTRLTEREKQVHRARRNNRTLRQIAEDLGITPQAVQQTLDRADRKMRAVMEMCSRVENGERARDVVNSLVDGD